MSQHLIRLEDVLARGVDVQWYEGVAIVQAVCREVLDTGRAGGFPAPGAIGLGPDGTVAVTGNLAAGHPVANAGHLLAQMLSDDVPVRLRLTVTQATGGDQSFGTLNELSEALRYFERPNPQLLLGALYDRAMLASFSPESGEAQPAARPAFTPVAPAPQPEAPKVEPKRPDPARAAAKKRLVRVAAIAVGSAAVVTLAVWGVFAGLASGKVAALGSKVANIIAPVQGSADTPLEKASAADKQKPAKSTAATAGRRDGSKIVSSRGERSQRAAAAAAPASTVGVVSPMRPRLTHGFTLQPPASDLVQTYVIMATPPADPADMVYSRADAAVRPPRQVYPALPPEGPPRVRREDLTVLELLIGTDGLVERVRLRTTPKDIHEFMLVSAAKAWRFQAAMLDGRPVRFLHNVAITTD